MRGGWWGRGQGGGRQRSPRAGVGMQAHARARRRRAASRRTATATWRERAGGALAHAIWRHLYCSGLLVSSSYRSLKA